MATDSGASSTSPHPFLRERITRKLERLSSERLYQVLDYVEFLESRYAEREPTPASVFQRFTEGLEDTMRAGRLSADTIAQTMGLMSRAMNVLSGVAAAGKSVASDVVSAAARSTQWPAGTREEQTPPAATPSSAPSTPDDGEPSK
jgi:hypothetical protein